MTEFFYVYVGAAASGNLAIGIDQGVWGWKTSVMEGHLPSRDGIQARRVAQQIHPGDYLILGHRGPNPRVPKNGWSASILEQVTFTQVTAPLYTAEDRVWPDDIYPERIGINVLDNVERLGGAHLGPHVMEAFRLSANIGGVPILAAPVDVMGLEAALPDDIDGFSINLDHDSNQILGISDNLDGFARAIVRREQKKLRRLKFGHRLELRCDLCGRLLPRRFVRAAHIKRRAIADHHERRNLANIFAACLLGCDEIFEHGYLYIDVDGRIQTTSLPKRRSTPDLSALCEDLQSRPCPAATPAAVEFFAWHRSWAITAAE